jgi:hypothetical protein
MYRCERAPKGRTGCADVSAIGARALNAVTENVEDPDMNTLCKLLIVGVFSAALAGCVVAPYGRPVRAYVAVPAPYVVVHPYVYYGPR